LQHENEMVFSQATKQETIYNHFLQHSGTYFARRCALNFSELGWQPRNLEHLDLPFSQDEIHEVIKSAPKEKAQGLMVL
jgi:hypothetical protein